MTRSRRKVNRITIIIELNHRYEIHSKFRNAINIRKRQMRLAKGMWVLSTIMTNIEEEKWHIDTKEDEEDDMMWGIEV